MEGRQAGGGGDGTTEAAAEVMSLKSSGRGSVEMSLECQAHKLGLDPVDLLSGIQSE